jgi:hypothetical protein
MILMVLSAELRGQAAWDGGANTGAWATANNWNPNAVPGTTALTFDADTANLQYVIDLGGNRTATGLVFGAATPPPIRASRATLWSVITRAPTAARC